MGFASLLNVQSDDRLVVATAPYSKQDQQQDYTNTQEPGSRRHQAAPPERIGTLASPLGLKFRLNVHSGQAEASLRPKLWSVFSHTDGGCGHRLRERAAGRRYCRAEIVLLADDALRVTGITCAWNIDTGVVKWHRY